MPIAPTKLSCVDVLDYFRQVELMGRRSWAYRGQSRYSEDIESDWRLESSLRRFLRIHETKGIIPSSWYPREREQLARFRGAAHLHLSHLPDAKDLLSWLALMQHYGSPTRLLDFTFNPAAALYFALREVGPNTGPFSVHALHLDRVRRTSQGARSAMHQYSDSTPPINPKISEYGIGDRRATIDFIGFFDGSQLNSRQEAQDGLFLIPSRIDLDVEEWLTEHLTLSKSIKPYGSPWLEFTFENVSTDYYKLVNQLVKAGMTAKRLFPGLEGICESMKYSWLEKASSFLPAVDLPNGASQETPRK